MSHPADAVLTLHNLRHRYAARDTFAGLDLALAPGSICCLLGPSGCGKTTVLRCIAGFERLSEGSIRIDGATVSSATEHLAPERRRVGMVFQDYALFPHLSVERNVAFGVRDDAVARERAAQLLEVVGLAGMGKRFPHELSGGQQQRVALARALAPQPRLLLLDEPSLGLAPLVVRQIFGAIRQLNRDTGLTVLLVEQNAYQALRLAHRGYVLVNGAITMAGPGTELLARPEIKAAYLEGAH